MKKIYKQFFYICTLISLFLFGLYSYTAQDITLDTIVSYIAYPFLQAQHIVAKPLASLLDRFKTCADLEQQLSAQRMQIEQLQAEHIELANMRDIVQKTAELRDFGQHYQNSQALLVQIIFKQLDAQSQFYLVDAGAQKNMAVDMVAVYKNCLVGRVTQVYPQYSKITLITDQSCKVAAFCAKTQVPGIHEGLNILTHTRLAFVNHLAKLELEDLVLSSGEGLIFPRGFGLGRIKKFELDGFDYKIDVQPLLDFKALEFCYIVSKTTQINPDAEVADRAAENSEKKVTKEAEVKKQFPA